MRILDYWFGESRESAEQAVLERARIVDSYRYLLRTAPPRVIERAHAAAFDELTLSQRHELVQELRQELRGGERACDVALRTRVLAQLATRAELRQPGMLERALGASEESLFCVVARAFVATPIAQQFLGGIDFDGAATELDDDDDDIEYEEAEFDTAPLESFLDRNSYDS